MGSPIQTDFGPFFPTLSFAMALDRRFPETPDFFSRGTAHLASLAWQDPAVRGHSWSRWDVLAIMTIPFYLPTSSSGLYSEITGKTTALQLLPKVCSVYTYLGSYGFEMRFRISAPLLALSPCEVRFLGGLSDDMLRY
jgi:hypothetical protein